MTTTAAEALAANVRAEAARRRIRRQDLAEQIGLSERATSRRMVGEVEWSATELQAVAIALGVDVASLMPDLTDVAS